MITITCPDCGNAALFESMRRGADEFCPNCDFPLFWAKTDMPTGSVGDLVDATRRRLPGTGGRTTIGTRVCPECAELNRLSATHCIRCGADLGPPPPPEPEPEPVVVVMAPPPPPPPAPTWPLWVAVAAGVVVWVGYLLLIA